MSVPPEVKQWVSRATKGVPDAAREAFSHELLTHYALALEHHLAQGVGTDEAHRLAMLELGGADEAHASASAVYGTSRIYVQAAAVAALVPLILSAFWLDAPSQWLFSDVLHDGVLLVGMGLILRAASILLAARYPFDDVARQTRLMLGGLMGIFLMSLYTALTIALRGSGGYSPHFLRLLVIVLWCAHGTFALATAWLGWRLANLHAAPRALTMTGWTMLLTGAVGAARVAHSIADGRWLLSPFVVANDVLLVLVFSLWVWVFVSVRHARRRAT